MPDTSEPTDPRYLDEVLRFLYRREKVHAFGGGPPSSRIQLLRAIETRAKRL